MQPIPIPKPAQSVFPISVQFPSRDRLLKVALFGSLFLCNKFHIKVLLSHIFISLFVCDQMHALLQVIVSLYVCLFICLIVFAQLQARLARLHSPRCLFCTQLRLGRKRLKWMSRTTVPRKKRIGSEKTVLFTQNQGGVDPERHFLNLNFSQKSITTYWRRLRGGLSWFILGSYPISILVPASPIWSLDLGKDGLEQAGQARQIPKPGLFGFFAFFSKAAGGKRWVGGASRKP